jgi:hypothetical protein
LIWHVNAKPWTKAEKARGDRMATEIGCIFCALSDIKSRCDERHHVKRGNKRMGHWFTLPLCEAHHSQCHSGTIRNAEQLDAWIKVQHILGLSDELPASKIVKRRELQTEAQRSVD